MRASNLITLSAAAVLAGGTSLALAAPLQSGSPEQGSMAQGNAPHAQHQHQSLSPRGGHQRISYQAAGPQAQSTPQTHGTQHMRSGPYAHANPRELSEAHGEAASGPNLSAQERVRLREIVHDIPQLSHIGNTDIRIDGLVPKTVRQAAVPLPPEVQHMHPRFRKDVAFRYRDQVVILNPTTARIVAIVKTPA
jgi:hypothetical protein